MASTKISINPAPSTKTRREPVGRIPASAIATTRVYPEAAIAFLLADARVRLADATVIRLPIGRAA